MMNGEEFIQATDGKSYYIEACLKSLIYGYVQLLNSKKTYSRAAIHKQIKKTLGSDNSHNEIEDFLSDDLISNYVKPIKHLFGLENFAINTGVRESLSNVKVGVLDVKFELPTLLKNHYFIFEAKRLDKYSVKQDYYVKQGVVRFTSGTYYPESHIQSAGMIGFVEVDLVKYPKGRSSLLSIKNSLNKRIKQAGGLTTTMELNNQMLQDNGYAEISSFSHVYVSKHTRTKDGSEITIHHLLFDYYDVLQN